jgi:cytochrome oxidase Cu insertion factor (SCO1/SenC/PrrC family)
MGNTISSNSPITNFFSKTEKTNNLDLINTLDFIACNYIFTLNYENMKKLYDKKYCDKLVVLTSDIINNYYNEIEVNQLSDRISFGENFLHKPKHEKIIYYQKSDITDNSKQSNCNKIAKFYVKIGHLFSAILTTISPEYIYKDPKTGEITKKTLQQKKDIPPGVKPQIVSNSLCTKRLNLLLQNQIKNPLNKDTYKQTDTLSEENGIPELMNLYLDSNYDFSTGLFTSMSPETELKYHKDLTDFYTSFTQEDIMPDTIKSFSDIKLKDNFKKYDITIEDYQLSNKSLMKKYAENIKNMIQRIDFIQQKLLDILNDVFIINEHEDNIRISPLLTETKLQQFIEECRENIVELYIHCEEDFVEGINIYEAIIEDILLKTTISQISSLQDILDKIFTTTPS